jgi:23S rRNA pseudouridine2605 synthase
VEAVTDEMTDERRRADAAGEDMDRSVEARSGGEGGVAPLRQRVDGIVESLLFAAGAPLALRRLVDVLDGPTAKDVKAAIERLMAEYNRRERGIHLFAVAGGYQFRSAPTNAEWVRSLLRERPARLGRAALETLSVIAYKQPATRAEIEAVRGVDADSAIASLLAKRLIKIAGRKEAVGRPLMYTTTAEFLEVFGLNDLSELPVLKEIGPVQEPEDEAVLDDGDQWGAAAKILSQAGISSRRAAGALIQAGRVSVNGRTVTELGTRAHPQRDRIALDGRPLRAAAPLAYLLLNKPVGVMTTLSDPDGRPTVRDLLTGLRQRVFPVGRLDYHSAGLLLLTNDGDLALRLSHPRYGIKKTYQVKVKGHPAAAQLTALATGVRMPDGVTAPASVRVLTAREHKAWLEITLAEGKNREVRRMCEAVGLPVEKLVRVALGPLKLGKLSVGAWRYLESDEVAKLRAAVRSIFAPIHRDVKASVPPGRVRTGRRDRARRRSD